MTTPNYTIMYGYLQGTIMGQLSNVKCFRENNLMSDKELLDMMIKSLTEALDKTIKGDIQ